ncbi:sNARE-like domain protein [Clostridium sp. CAG:921]|nr:sNARE-like domain protein [Clostridium sp. CAG:921]
MKKLTKKERNMAIIRLILTVLVFIACIVITIKVLPIVSKLSDENYRVYFKEKVNAMGFKGVIFVLLLQILQIVVAVIPGQPMEIVSGMLYGPIGGIFVCLVGIFIGTAIVFYLVRKLGTDFMQLFFSPEKIDSIKNSKIFKNSAKFEFIMLIIFVIPMMPKDIFIYLGGISPVSPKRFLAIATLARIPGLFLTVYMGNRISNGNFSMVVVLIAIILIIAAIGYFIYSRAEQKFEKDEA